MDSRTSALLKAPEENDKPNKADSFTFRIAVKLEMKRSFDRCKFFKKTVQPICSWITIKPL